MLSEMRQQYTEAGSSPVQVFRDIDEAGTGTLTYWEFYKGFKTKGFKIEQRIAEKLMAVLDRTGSGKVDVKDFEKVFGHLDYKATKVVRLELKANPNKGVWDQVLDALGSNKERITDQVLGMDLGRTGKMSYWEFGQALKRVNIKLDKKAFETLVTYFDEKNAGEVVIQTFLDQVLAQFTSRALKAADDAKRAELNRIRAAEREAARKAYEAQQADLLKAAQLSSYEVRTAWNRVNRAISSKGKAQMTKLFLEFDTDGGGTVDRDEFREGLARLGVKLTGPEFEACWQYADPRGEGELSMDYFVNGLGEIDPEVDKQSKAHSTKLKEAKRKQLATLSGLDPNTGANPEEEVPLHEAWLALSKYFGKGKAKALATFKQIDTDRGGTLDPNEFRIFIAMLNLKLSDAELSALWRAIDTDGNGSLSFDELQSAVLDQERRAAEEKAVREARAKRAEAALIASAAAMETVTLMHEAWEQLDDFIERNGVDATKAFFYGFDSTGHGTLSPAEFRNALLTGPKVTSEAHASL
jgi:Ca2+-binding EF-hand superfamily protein